MYKNVHIFLFDDRGATAIEYSMVACLIFLAIVGTVQSLGASIVGVLYNKIETLF